MRIPPDGNVDMEDFWPRTWSGDVAFIGRPTSDDRILRELTWEPGRPIPLIPVGEDVGVLDVLGAASEITMDGSTIKASGRTSLPPGRYGVGITLRHDMSYERDGELVFVLADLGALAVYADGTAVPAWADAYIEVAP